MIRRNIVIAVLVAFLGAIAFAPGAMAQGDDDSSDDPHANPQATQTCASYNNCPVGPTTNVPSSAEYDPGDLSQAFANSEGPSAEVIPQVQPTPVPEATTTDVQSPQLAFTGAETDVLTWVGSGMIALGSLALVARRRLSD